MPEISEYLEGNMSKQTLLVVYREHVALVENKGYCAWVTCRPTP